MPIYTYTKDLRKKEGELARAGDIKDNFGDIQDAVNGLTWLNVDTGSLDQFHVKPGESYKEIEGGYSEVEPAGSAVFPTWIELGRLSVPVRPDNGVYVVASVSWDASSTTLYSLGPRQIQLKLSARTTANGSQTGSWGLPWAHNIEANGGASVVWAYRVDSGTEHEISLEYTHHTSDAGPKPGRPARVNLVVFVIDR